MFITLFLINAYLAEVKKISEFFWVHSRAEVKRFLLQVLTGDDRKNKSYVLCNLQFKHLIK